MKERQEILLQRSGDRGRRDMIFLAAMTVVLYILPALALNGVSADSVEYLIAGQNFWEGRGFMIEIVGYVVPDYYKGFSNSVLHPPGYSLLAGFLFSKTGNIHPVQVLNVILAAANVVIIYRITLLMSRRRIAILAGVLVAWMPTMAHHSYQVMSEQLSLFFDLLTVWCILTWPLKGRAWLIGGILAGLAYMTRTANVVLVLALLTACVGATGCVIRKRAINAACLVGGVLLVVMPATMVQSQESDAIFRNYAPLFRVLDFHDLFVVDDPSRVAVTPYRLLQEQFPAVLQRILSNGGRYLTLLISSHWLSLASVGLPFAIAAVFLRGDFRFLALGLIAIFKFLLISATWYWFDPRYMLLTYVFLLPLCLIVLDTWWTTALPSFRLDRLAFLIAAGIAILILVHPRVTLVARLNAAAIEMLVKGSETERIASREWFAVTEWLQSRGGREIVIAANDPGELHWRTRVPALILPEARNGRLLLKFLHDYHVSYILLDRPPEDLPGSVRRFYAESFAPESNGPVFQYGSLQLYAIPRKAPQRSTEADKRFPAGA